MQERIVDYKFVFLRVYIVQRMVYLKMYMDVIVWVVLAWR